MQMTLEVNESVLEKFMNVLSEFKENVKVIDGNVEEKPDFIVSSVEEVRRRVKEAEEAIERGEYLTEEEFWAEMDEYVENL